jgi:Leucine-rich repeat (LRR) protein
MEIRLTAQSLAQLPESDWVRPDVTGIYAGFNQLTALPPWFARLPDLQILRLNHNLITAPVAGLDSLLVLRELNLSSNPLLSFPHAINRLPRLEKLWLDRTDLSELPDTFRCGHLLDLALSRNAIAQLPDELFTGPARLRGLDLSQNQLRTLPLRLEGLEQVRELDLSYNRLESLPATIGGLQHLEVLHLQGNRLQTLPVNFGRLRRLRRLNLYENRLTALPDSFGQLSALEELDLSRNDLTSLPKEIGGCTALRRLVLSENELTSLPTSFCRLHSLKEAHLGRNNLRELPDGGDPQCLPSLETLAIQGNVSPSTWKLPEPYRKALLQVY